MSGEEDEAAKSVLVKDIHIGADLVKGVDISSSVRVKRPLPVSQASSKRPRKEFDDVHIPCPVMSSSSSTSETSIASCAETSSSINELDEENFIEDIPIDNPSIEEPFAAGFYDSYDYDSDPLFESSGITVIQSLAILFDWFSSFPGISKAAFSQLFYVLHSFILPKGNNLPDSYSKGLALVQHLLVPIAEYDACINDCVLFRKCSKGDYSDLESCPECNTGRFQENTKVARKRFQYIPIGCRIKRMFSDESVSKLLQSHLVHADHHKREISDLHMSPMWKTSYSENGQFGGDPRGVSLGLCVDGMNPFSKERVSYSMWPITISILNLPFSLRNKPGSMLLAGIIPGKNEPKNLNPYLEVLIDEVLQLTGSDCYDAYQQEKFQLSIDILMTTVDYPGLCKLFHCVGANAYSGCAYCTLQGTYSKILQKMVYPGSRQFLSITHPLRKDTTHFPSKQSNTMPIPSLKTMEYVDAAIKEFTTADSMSARKEIVKKTGCKGFYSLKALPTFDRLLKVPVDPMHLIKNIASHVVLLITGIEDSIKVRKEEESLRRFPNCWMRDTSDRLPPAPFRLTDEEIALADARATKIFVPYGFDWTPREIFKSTSGLKSHEWKLLSCCGILTFCLRGMLGAKQRSTLFMLFEVLKSLLAECISLDAVDALEQKVHLVLAYIERDFPLSMQVIVFHLLHHLPMFVKSYGPVFSFWMYPYERYNSWIKRRVLNRALPEATVVQTYRLSEWAHFMELSGKFEKETFAFVDSTDDEMCFQHDVRKSVGSKFSLTGDDGDLLCDYYMLKEDQSSIAELPISQEGIRLKHFRYLDNNGRLVELGCAEAEVEHSHVRSSYVSFASSMAPVQIGRIVYFFQHTFRSTTTTFAYVSFFDGPYTDPDSSLHFVLCSNQTQSFVDVMDMSKPLIVAYDDEEVDKIWILNL